MPTVSLVLPTRDAGADFPEILGAILDQDLQGELEVIAIDSGSTDGTLDLLRARPVRLVEIPRSEFDHGATRNLGVQEARGAFVAFTVQDARPMDSHWLQRLVDCFADSRVAGAYSCQIPRADANPFILERLRNWAGAQLEPRRQEVAGEAELMSLAPLDRLRRVAFDNVSSCVRRSVALEIPFRRKRFAEDLDWGYRVVLAGYAIVFEPRSKVVHSHDRSTWYEFKRIYVDHQNLNDLLGITTVPTGRSVVTSTRAAVPALWRAVREDARLHPLERLAWRAKALPYAFSQNLAQFLGARSAEALRNRSRFYRMLDRVLRKGV